MCCLHCRGMFDVHRLVLKCAFDRLENARRTEEEKPGKLTHKFRILHPRPLHYFILHNSISGLTWDMRTRVKSNNKINLWKSGDLSRKCGDLLLLLIEFFFFSFEEFFSCFICIETEKILEMGFHHSTLDLLDCWCLHEINEANVEFMNKICKIWKFNLIKFRKTLHILYCGWLGGRRGFIADSVSI